jgi:hypothetical protein
MPRTYEHQAVGIWVALVAYFREDRPVIASSRSCRVLLLDPALQSLVQSVCEKHQWALRVIGDRWDTVLPEESRPKLILLGFAPSDASSLEFLHDLYLDYPDVSVAAIIGDSLVHVDIMVSPGGRSVVVTPTCPTQPRKFPTWKLVA